MILAVLDVNVLVSGFPARGGTPAEVIECWTEAGFELVLSEHILGGVARAWRKRYYLARYTEDEARGTIDLLRSDANIVIPVATVHGVGDDEEDDQVLATAVAGRASYLETGDKGLQRLRVYEGIMILFPREFLDVLRQDVASPD